MKFKLILIALLALLALPMMAGAATYTFSPYDANGTTQVFDMDHDYLYIWGINAPTSYPNEIITSAAISIKNIYNWIPEWNILKFYMVDNPNINDNAGSVDIISINDGASNPKEVPDLITQSFTAYTPLNTYFQDNDGAATVNQFSYTLNASELALLIDYLNSPNTFGTNATVGLAFDPDCHFFNDGISLEITTSPVPEPGTVLLLGAGLLGLAGLRLKRRN